MIEFLNKKKCSDLISVWDFLKRHVHPDFYLTENNQRMFITDYNSFKKLLKQSHNVLFSKEKGDVNGVVLIWKGIGEGVKRNYIKINAIDKKIADKLLSILLWNFNKDLYVKVKKGSIYLSVFKNKNFIFLGGRGRELLLFHKIDKKDKKINVILKEK